MRYTSHAFILIIWCLCPRKVLSSDLSLTVIPDFRRFTICPGLVQFTCRGNQTQNLTWHINDTIYIDPLNVNIPLPIPLQIMVINRDINNGSVNNTVNITTTLSADASVLQGLSIQCVDMYDASQILTIDHVGVLSNTSFLATCSIIQTAGVPEVSIQWSPYFTSQYDVEMYHVAVDPANPNCSDQMIASSVNYNCSTLLPGRLYSFTVSALNCVYKDTFTVQAQVPEVINGVVLIYEKYGQFYELRVQWIEKGLPGRCYGLINYTVVLEETPGRRLGQSRVDSSSCTTDDICSTVFFLSDLLYQEYHFVITITNSFGSSEFDSGIFSFPSFDGVPEDCFAYVLCSFSSSDCFIQYGLDPSYEDLLPPILVPDNAFLPIPLSMANIYYQISLNTSTSFFIRKHINIKDFQFEFFHYALLAQGILWLCAAVTLSVVITWASRNISKKGSLLYLVFLVIGYSLILLSVILFVVLGIAIGVRPKKNPCDPTWKSAINGLFISAGILSFISFLAIQVSGLLYNKCCRRLLNHFERNKERFIPPNWFVNRPPPFPYSDGHSTRPSHAQKVYIATRDTFTAELMSIACFHDISSRKAQELLRMHIKSDGHYLLCPSNEKKALCTIYVTNSCKIVNYELKLPPKWWNYYKKKQDKYFYIHKGVHFPSIAALLVHYQTNPINTLLDTRLLYPIFSSNVLHISEGQHLVC